MSTPAAAPDNPSFVAPCRPVSAFGGGALIGALGGLIGLGGAEFRLPLLIGAFRFAALQAVILNKGHEPDRRCNGTSFSGWHRAVCQHRSALVHYC
jgi:hypothetical protein